MEAWATTVGESSHSHREQEDEVWMRFDSSKEQTKRRVLSCSSNWHGVNLQHSDVDPLHVLESDTDGQEELVVELPEGELVSLKLL